MKFPCTICGACCKNIAGIKDLESFDAGNGICKHLDMQTNRCKIYTTRPQICRIEEMYSKVFFTQYSKEAFYTLNIQSCRILQEKEGVDESLRL